MGLAILWHIGLMRDFCSSHEYLSKKAFNSNTIGVSMPCFLRNCWADINQQSLKYSNETLKQQGSESFPFFSYHNNNLGTWL